ncbi:DUF500-domain-containing protein [Atractiella rhizophila]|nr:DUF500-domain-containing protein [Atractiella rhizophila]
MAPLNPLPVNLPKECAKCSSIFSSFVTPSKGLDGVIPPHVLRSAKGFAIFQVVKMGFLFSARAGTGVVIAKLPDGSWSAPSAIGTGGAGFGAQAGAEITDFLIILNSRAAVKSFMSAGSLQLGGNLSIAVGPMGRNTEGSAGLNTKGKVATMYSYSKTRGLFGGVSVEGSVIVERSDANRLAYHSNVTASQLLSGSVDAPQFAKGLIETIERCVGEDTSGWIKDKPMTEQWREGEGSYAFAEGVGAGGVGGVGAKGRKLPRRNTGNSATMRFDSQFTRDDADEDPWLAQERQKEDDRAASAATRSRSKSNPNPQSQRSSSPDPFSNQFSSLNQETFNRADYTDSSGDEERYAGGRETRSRPSGISRQSTGTSVGSWKSGKMAIALFDFAGVEAGDLSFKKGDVIEVVEKGDEEWWTGKVGERKGIFPKNYTKIEEL